MFIPVLAMESCDSACVGSFAFDFNGLAIRYITMPNPRLLQIKKHFILFYFRELKSAIKELEPLVQREVENLKENIIKLDKEITRLEKIENDARIFG